MDEFNACYCDTGYLGRNCHIDKNGYEKLESAYNEIFNKLIGEVQSNIKYYEFEVFHNLFFGACQFIEDSDYFAKNLETFFTLAKRLGQISILNNTAEYFDLLDYYYSYELMRMEQQKAKLKVESGLKYRNFTLTESQMQEYKTGFDYITEEIINLMEYITRLYIPTKNSFYYESKNFYIALTPIEPSFNEKLFFRNRKVMYKSYVEFMNCINYMEVERLKNPNYYLYMFYVEYFYIPYGYNSTITINNTSPLIELKFYDASKNQSIKITGCNNENAIRIYFPYKSYKYLEEFNSQKDMYDPLVYKGADDPLFKDPIYIEPNGHVTNSTIEDRIEKFNRHYNISPQYFDTDLKDFNDSGLTYLNFTSDTNYIIFNSTHTTKFSAFFVKNNATFHTSSRFFYLRHPRIIIYFPNYSHAIGGVLFLLLLVLYIIFVSVFTGYDKRYSDQDGFLEYLKEEIVNLFLHYKKENEKKKVKEDRNLIPNNLKKNYNHRNFWNSGVTEGAVGFGSVNTEESKNGNYVVPFSSKRMKGKKTKIGDNFMDDLNDDLDEDISNLQKGKASKKKSIKNNFFSGGEVKLPSKNAEAALRRKQPDLFYSRQMKKNRYDPNSLPTEFENAQEARAERMQEFADISLTEGEFLRLNIIHRNILINTFCIVSIFNPRWKKLTLLMTESSVILVLNSVLLTSNEKAILSNIKSLFLYSFIVMLMADAVIYMIAFFFKFPSDKLRRLYKLVTTGGQLSVLKEWEITEKIQKKKCIIGFIIAVIIWMASFYISFGFTVVWRYQNSAFLAVYGIIFALDFIVCDFLIELLIAICYTQRKHNCFLRGISEGLNRIRNYRCLSP